ncbi:MAG: xanthine dehydrogenase small subunit [Hyphomicrobiales bacterium]|nr:MAG: xanthine dehydrogenase small subunit [Hyphomicrobiales bacterium]
MEQAGHARTRDRVRIMIGWEPREFPLGDPNRTLLQLLREDFGLAGTKEGCAEGDCGACTVLVGRLDGDTVRYRAVNACIVFPGTLDGCQVLTVEHVALDGLHPAQAAMVAEGGSQCGFCTPGFVMSLVGMHLNETGTERRAIDDALAGNLCRCTGYGPIVAAARRMAGEPAGAAWEKALLAAEAQLKAWAADDSALICESASGFFAAPRSRADLAALMAEHPDATLIAGATDAGLWVTKQGRKLNKQIHVGSVTELHAITDTADQLEIGAAATYAEAEAVLVEAIPGLAGVLRRIGSTQVRNSGTIGGNIANGSPIGDTPPALIALGATLVLQSAAGTREIPLQSFFIEYGRQDRQPGEFVASVRIPKPIPESFRCYKISKRFDQDISAVLGAFAVEIVGGTVKSARIAFGGMAGTPMRTTHAEDVLTGAPWSAASIEATMAALAEDFTPMTDMRASAAYRMAVARNLLKRYYLDISGEGPVADLSERMDGEVAHV